MRNSTDVPAGPRTSNAALCRTAGRIAPLLAGALLALPVVAPAQAQLLRGTLDTTGGGILGTGITVGTTNPGTGVLGTGLNVGSTSGGVLGTGLLVGTTGPGEGLLGTGLYLGTVGGVAGGGGGTGGGGAGGGTPGTNGSAGLAERPGRAAYPVGAR